MRVSLSCEVHFRRQTQSNRHQLKTHTSDVKVVYGFERTQSSKEKRSSPKLSESHATCGVKNERDKSLLSSDPVTVLPMIYACA